MGMTCRRERDREVPAWRGPCGGLEDAVRTDAESNDVNARWEPLRLNRASGLWSCIFLVSFLPSVLSVAKSAPFNIDPRVQGRVAVVPGDEQRWILAALSRQPAGVDSLPARAVRAILWLLSDDEGTCRTGLASKEEEPGSPWLSWHSLARIEQDSTLWHVGAVSCVDSLCGSDLYRHDRLAILGIGRHGMVLTLYPQEAPTIASERAEIDSLKIYRGPDRILLVARLGTDSQHPCSDGPESYAGDTGYFVLLRGGQVAQAFRIDLGEDSASHDDVDGDAGTTQSASLHASADSVTVAYQLTDWHEQSAPPWGEERHVTDSGVVRLVYDPDSTRFVRVE